MLSGVPVELLVSSFSGTVVGAVICSVSNGSTCSGPSLSVDGIAVQVAAAVVVATAVADVAGVVEFAVDTRILCPAHAPHAPPSTQLFHYLGSP